MINSVRTSFCESVRNYPFEKEFHPMPMLGQVKEKIQMKQLRKLPVEMRGPGVRELADLALQVPGAIDLSVGQPDFDTPSHIVDAACEAARAGYTKYSQLPGFLSLREKLVAKLQQTNHMNAHVDNITVTPGGTFGLAVSAMSVTEVGDEILVPNPGYPTFEQIVSLHGGISKQYLLEEQNDYLPDIKDLQRIVSDRTKAIIINSPSNPTGAVFPIHVMESIVDFAVTHDLYIISDEVYETIVFEGEHISPATLDQDNRVISVFSFSKTYAMTGWRVGYTVAPPAVSGVVRALLGSYTGSASSVSQKAAEAALDGDQSCVHEMRESYRRRRDVALGIFEDLGLQVFCPQGAFYFFIDVSQCHMDSVTFAKELLQETQVAVRPGELFGPEGKGYVRVSFAASEDALIEGIRRLGLFIRRYD